MNIFIVDYDPWKAAESLVDRHVVKMILESAQMLSTTHRLCDGDENGVLNDEREEPLYRITHKNHPCTKWVMSGAQNYLWLVKHWLALMSEYEHRYGKKHACERLRAFLIAPPEKIYEWSTPYPCAMDESYKISKDVVENYRNYYNMGKSHLFKWTKRNPPEWVICKSQ